MKIIELKPRLGASKTRSDFLAIMPVLREYILQQSKEFPQKCVVHTLARLIDQCPEIVITDEECVKIVGCIDTEKPPFQTFWVFANATLEALASLNLVHKQQTVTPVYHTIGTIAIVSSAVRAYITGIRIYNAARYAFNKPIQQSRLGDYWARVKIF